MKAFIAAVLAVFIGVLAPFGGSAIAADLAAGAQVFASNCAACHIGGNNAVMAQKT